MINQKFLESCNNVFFYYTGRSRLSLKSINFRLSAKTCVTSLNVRRYTKKCLDITLTSNIYWNIIILAEYRKCIWMLRKFAINKKLTRNIVKYKLKEDFHNLIVFFQ